MGGWGRVLSILPVVSFSRKLPADGVRVEEEHGSADDALEHSVVQAVRSLCDETVGGEGGGGNGRCLGRSAES